MTFISCSSGECEAGNGSKDRRICGTLLVVSDRRTIPAEVLKLY